jgi:Flp pilus assembly protein TadG
MRSDRQHGQTLAEFALAFPIFILLVLGLFDVGRAVFVYNAMTNAAREGARLAIVNQDKALVAKRAQDMAFGTAITTPAASLVRFYKSSPNSDDVTANQACDNSDAQHAVSVGCVAVVVTQSTVTMITPIVGNLVGPITVSARSELPLEFVCPNSKIVAYATSNLCPKQP